MEGGTLEVTGGRKGVEGGTLEVTRGRKGVEGGTLEVTGGRKGVEGGTLEVTGGRKGVEGGTPEVGPAVETELGDGSSVGDRGLFFPFGCNSLSSMPCLSFVSLSISFSTTREAAHRTFISSKNIEIIHGS